MGLALTGTLDDERRVWPLDATPIRIGRAGANAICIQHDSVSREHAEVALRNGRLYLRDLKSRNGTWLNGAPVRRPAELHTGDRILIGRVRLFVAETPAWPISEAGGRPLATTLLKLPPASMIAADAKGRSKDYAVTRKVEAFVRHLAGRRSLRATFDAVLSGVQSALPATRVILFLRPDADDGLVVAATNSKVPSFADQPAVPMNALLEVLKSGKPLLLADIGAGGTSRVPAPPDRRSRTVLAVPLLHESRALGILYAEHDSLESGYRREHLELLGLFATMAALRIANERMSLVEQRHLITEHEIAMASRIQRSLLPSGDVRIPGYDLHATLEQCEAIGGDFYDVHAGVNGEVWIMLGDVVGKGICAALLLPALICSARVLYDVCTGPAALAWRLNLLMHGYADAGIFVTTFIGRLEPESGALDFVNAGHPSALLVEAEGLSPLASTAYPLGIESNVDFKQETATLSPGSTLAIFSDGLPEARRGSRLFGLPQVELAIRNAMRHGDLEEAGRRVIERVDAFLAGAPRSDDIALLMLRRAGHPDRSRRRPVSRTA